MGCRRKIRVWLSSPLPVPCVSLCGELPEASLELLSRMPASCVSCAGGGAKASLGLSSPMPFVKIGLVCKAETDPYLRVTPEEPLWITVDSGIDYDVRSNTEWIIV